MKPAEFRPGTTLWHAGQRWRVTALEGELLHIASADATELPEHTTIHEHHFGECHTAEDLARVAAPGPWTYRMSPFGSEAVIEGPAGTVAQLDRSWLYRTPVDEEQRLDIAIHFERLGPFEATVHLMAHAPLYRQALAQARDILADGGPDAAQQALAVLEAALEG